MKRLVWLLLILLVLMVGSNINQTIIKAENKIIEKFFGNWEVKKEIATAEVFSEEDSRGVLGKKIILTSSFVSFDNKVCKNPIYRKIILTKADFESGYRVRFRDLGITQNSLVCVQILQNNGREWECPVAIFFIKDNNKLIITTGGVFFEGIRI